ncbi:interferon-induced GTP-binding protein mx2 [Grosmannia clavigera kw1407]|uniref:Interferon-induced GTP-binding protein mx2 n=1 Tax=Grosmannia clavigera (strain kw1407 / UAMH 11150) TaxID=655863 RepID=F0X6P6_GROCL|nr:interferon-induced GTP-binding protein mx2 [Grosmannia clavigera kw1407]EFX06352.1 interferon-induced GTP-binding protein mx2 [Grosmannia clavigera kw1407]
MASKANGQQAGLLNSPVLLRKIDQMREKNVGQYLPLPQLVAVGDQSSGKSSLLESLTGISFPHAQELCTRYATQITHRRDDYTHIDVSIIPGPHATPADSLKLKAYGKRLQSGAELTAQFSTILSEVNTLMDIKTTTNPSGSKTFTEDTLKIEKCGPNEDYLTVIDVPGIFRTTTAGVTTAKDQDLVRNMVKEYIKNSRTIILAVLPSNVDVATQEILTLAESYDKAGERTLGILTKPDLVTERSAKLSVCSLVEGKKKPLTLGYFVVRNRGGDDEDEDDEDDKKGGSSSNLYQREAMFQEEPWRSLPDDRVGISALRERLQELLGQITHREFPKLRAETRQLLEEARTQLRELGPARQTEREQQQYLSSMAGRFQSFVRAALNADYSAHSAFEDERLRLITAVANITDEFSKEFRSKSRTYLFETEDTDTTTAPLDPASSPAGSDNSGEITPGGSNRSTPDEFSDLDGIVTEDTPVLPPMEGIKLWIESVYRQSRGIELGTFGLAVLTSVFREQSAKWGPMTEQFLSRIIRVVHGFIFSALEVVCVDEKVREDLMAAIMTDLCARYRDAMGQAKLLVDVERQLKPYTLNHYFNSNHQKSQGLRMAETLRPIAHYGFNDNGRTLHVDFDKIATTVSNKSNEEHAVENIHDILRAYYGVATKRFADNVFQQAVDYKLLSGPSSPLNIFSEQWVLQLSEDELAAVVGESRMTRDRRGKLKKKIEDLEAAVNILR